MTGIAVGDTTVLVKYDDDHTVTYVGYDEPISEMIDDYVTAPHDNEIKSIIITTRSNYLELLRDM